MLLWSKKTKPPYMDQNDEGWDVKKYERNCVVQIRRQVVSHFGQKKQT